MSNDRLERALSEAIDDLAAERAPDYLHDILEQTSRTRQRPWWTFPSRYPPMSTTFRFATVGALALAVGIGISPLLQAFTGGDGSAPSGVTAEAPVQLAPPTAVSGSIACSLDGATEPSETSKRFEVDGSMRVRTSRTGGQLLLPVESDDPRFSGRASAGWADHEWVRGTNEGVLPFALSSDIVIEAEGGSWAGGWQTFHPGGEYDPTTFDYPVGTVVFEGKDGYDGLTAVVDVDYRHNGSSTECRYDFDGYIVDWPRSTAYDEWAQRESSATISTKSEAPDESLLSEPVAFSGEVGCERAEQPSSVGVRTVVLDGAETVVISDDFAEAWLVMASSDSRLAGLLREFRPMDGRWLPSVGDPEPLPELTLTTWVIENEGGAWTGSFPTLRMGADPERSERRFPQTVVALEGSGDYAGLTALVHADRQYDAFDRCAGTTIEGLVVSGGLPEVVAS